MRPLFSVFFLILAAGLKAIFSFSTPTRKTSEMEVCQRLKLAGDHSLSSARSNRKRTISCLLILSAGRSPKCSRRTSNLSPWL